MALSLRDDCDGAQLELAARRSDNSDQVRRLLTVAAIYDGASRAEAARTGGVTRQIDQLPTSRAAGRNGGVISR